MSRILGYLVMESCDDHEQALCVVTSDALPAGGLLAWSDPRSAPRAMFADRKSARAAIKRTDHYRLAFTRRDLPEARFCVIVPVKAAPLEAT